MLKKILNKIPESTIKRLMRFTFKLPELTFDPDFQVKIADSQDELEVAYQLLHDCYTAQKLMSPHVSGLRCNIFSFLPETTTIVAIYKGKTVGTVTLIKDSRVGLPSDEKYKRENDALRSKGCHLIEVSSLAVAKEFRSTNHAVSLLLMKFLYNHAKMMGGTELVITINPRAEKFYRAMFDFQRSGEVVRYDYVNGAPAIYMSKHIVSTEVHIKWASSFRSDNIKRNLALWFIDTSDERFVLPKLEEGMLLSPVLTPELMEYFFVKKTNLLEELPKEKVGLFFEVLIHFYGDAEIFRFKKYFVDLELREFRMSVCITCSLETREQFFIVNLLDVSANGALVEGLFDERIRLNKEDKVVLRFRIGKRSFQINSEIRWFRKTEHNSNVKLFGVRFSHKNELLKKELLSMHNVSNEEEAA